MDSNKNNNLAHPVRPYDDSLWEHWSMYDNMPYRWDKELYEDKKTRLFSGNIIKSNRYQIIEPLEIKH